MPSDGLLRAHGFILGIRITGGCTNNIEAISSYGLEELSQTVKARKERTAKHSKKGKSYRDILYDIESENARVHGQTKEICIRAIHRAFRGPY
jgi:hypothetical protein